MNKHENLTERQKIVACLNYALDQAEFNKYKGVNFAPAKYTNIKEYTRSINRLIDSKILLFNKLDEKSATYHSILANAKRALPDIQAGLFDFNSAELINKFLSLEEIFHKELKFTGVRRIEDADRSDIKQPAKDVKKSIQNKIEKEVYVEGNVKYVPEGVTGKQLKRLKERNKAVELSLSEVNFDELDFDGTTDSSSIASSLEF